MNRAIIVQIYPILVIVAIFILNYLSLFGFFSYVSSMILFTLIGLSGLYLIRKFNVVIVDKRIILISVVSGVVQILISVFVAFFTGFGGSPYLTTALGTINNILFFTTNLFGFELLRSFILLNLSIKSKLTLIIVTAVVITLASLSLPQIVALNTPLSVFDYVGSNILPSLSQNGLATLFAFTGGPLASLAYRLTITGFEWLSPILPDFSWILKTALGVALPILGLFIFTESASKQLLIRKGLVSRRELRLSSRTKKGELGWFIVLVVSITLVWGSLGLFGPKPEVIASGSMTPTLNVGDIVIVTPTTSKDLVKGEIISYYRSDLSAPVIHRIVNLSSQGGDLLITTKGDANNADDAPFSASSRTVFKTLLIVPKIGWVSIFLKEIPSMVSSYVGK